MTGGFGLLVPTIGVESTNVAALFSLLLPRRNTVVVVAVGAVVGLQMLWNDRTGPLSSIAMLLIGGWFLWSVQDAEHHHQVAQWIMRCVAGVTAISLIDYLRGNREVLRRLDI